MMRIKKKFFVADGESFVRKALYWANKQPHFCFLNGNEREYAYGCFPKVLAVGAIQTIEHERLSNFSDILEARDWFFGYLGYGFGFPETNGDKLGFGHGFFFQPQTLIHFYGVGVLEIESTIEPDKVLDAIQADVHPPAPYHSESRLEPQLSKESYIQIVEQLKNHLNRGDIYQINFCMEFIGEGQLFPPIHFYELLNAQSPMPFSGLLKRGHSYILCASPERYLKRLNNKLVSQPMKGTAPRAIDPMEDQTNAHLLKTSKKERAENIMIVDLVRNDLSRICKAGTVAVEELCKVYSFEPVHQMVSTVVGTLVEQTQMHEILATTFPMGSMTGAPKIRAMELIAKYESSPRGIFSGSLGYFEPDGNFDFNVLIRSVFYNEATQMVSCRVGSGITALSDPASEYEECMLKAQAIQRVFSKI